MTKYTERWGISFPEGTQKVAVPKDVQDNAYTTAQALDDQQADTTAKVQIQIDEQIAAAPFGYTVIWNESLPAGHEQGTLATVAGSPDFTQGGKFKTAFTTDGATALATNDSEILVTAEMASAPGVTLEAWFRSSTNPIQPADAVLMLGAGVKLGVTPAGYARLDSGASGSSWIANTGVVVTDGAWHHLAAQISHDDGTWTIHGLWVDGAYTAGRSDSGAYESQPRLGIAGKTGQDRSSDLPAGAQVDEPRVSLGARYTSAGFTPPTGPFTFDADTLILAHFDNGAIYGYSVEGGGYPTRPDVPGGQVLFVGPEQPTTWLENDQWIKAEV